MMLEKIKSIKQMSNFRSDRVFLIEKIDEQNGFFLFEEKLTFARLSENNSGTNLATSMLDYFPCVNLKSVENDPSFQEGYFDFLVLKTDDKDLIASFISLCRAYVKDGSVSFNDFIVGMIDLFQLPKRESKLNAIGLFGELYLIKTIFERCGIDFTNGWHLSGAFSKYDFSFDKFNLEVKTSTVDSTSYLIKHSQLFNENKNFIGLVRLEKVDNGGNSLSELIDLMKNETPFAENVRFQIALQKELKKEFEIDTLEQRYVFKSAFFFENNQLETIENIPFCITEIEYRYDFDITESLSFEDFIDNISR